ARGVIASGREVLRVPAPTPEPARDLGEHRALHVEVVPAHGGAVDLAVGAALVGEVAGVAAGAAGLVLLSPHQRQALGDAGAGVGRVLGIVGALVLGVAGAGLAVDEGV